jgi:site-specific DNA-cytosine methylase
MCVKINKLQNGVVAPSYPQLEEAERLRLLDLFCGAGALSYGLKESGLVDVRWGVDSNKSSTESFQANFPNAFAHHMTVDEFYQHIVKVNVTILFSTCSEPNISGGLRH